MRIIRKFFNALVNLLKSIFRKLHKSSRKMEKNSLLYEAKIMCNIANGLTNYLFANHREYLNNEVKKYSISLLKIAVLRMDSCTVLLENGSSVFIAENNSKFIDPFSISTLVRSIYEVLAVHYYYFYLHPNDCYTNVLVSLWKMSGIKNRLTPDNCPIEFKDKYDNDKEIYSKLKVTVEDSEVYKKSSNQDLLKKSMKQLKLLKFQEEDNSYNVELVTYGPACKDIFAGTNLYKTHTFIYKLYSAISHPSYLNCIQVQEHNGAYNKYTETIFVGGILLLKRLIDNIIQVIPEGKEFVDSLPSNIKTCFDKWKLYEENQ